MSIYNKSCNRRPVKKGTTILTEKPFAYIVESTKRDKICNYCLQRTKLLRCSACQHVYYCDRKCQKGAWPLHKIECRYLKTLPPTLVLDDIAWLMARVIIKLSQGGADETSYYSETCFRKFNDLESDYSKIKKDEKRMQHFALLRPFLLEFLDSALRTKLSDSALLVIYGKVCTNSIHMLKVVSNDLNFGVGLFLAASLLNHRCKPNVIIFSEGTTLVVRTLVDLPSLDWSQLGLSYIDSMDINKQEKLYSILHFRCDCETCKGLEPKAAACPNSSCVSPCSIETDECEECGAKLSEDFKRTFREVTDITIRANITNHLVKDDSPFSIYVSSKKCLKKQKGILHRFNVHRMRTIEIAYEAAITLNLWEDAELYGKALEPGYLFYYGEMFPKRVVLYSGMAEIYFNLKKLELGFEALEKAHTIVTIIYGNEHSAKMNEIFQHIFSIAVDIKDSNPEIMRPKIKNLFYNWVLRMLRVKSY